MKDKISNLKEFLYVFVLSFFPLIPAFLSVLKLSYINYANCSDVFFYLDIAKNIAQGRGFVTSFNYYCYWPGIFFPAQAFVFIGFPLFLSPYFLFFKSIEPLFFLNFVICFFNAWLIYKIVKRLYKDKVFSFWSVVLIASTVSWQLTVFRILTEPLSLFFVLCGLWLFFSCVEDSLTDHVLKRNISLIGILLALSIFVRSAALFIPLVFFLSYVLSSKSGKIRRSYSLPFLILPFGIVLIYGVIIFLKFHMFPVQYPLAFKNFYLATYSCGGGFFTGTPVCRPACLELAIFKNIVNNFMIEAKVLFCLLRLLLLFSILKVIKIFIERKPVELILAGLSVLQILLTPFLYFYVSLNEFEGTRFLFLPVIFLMILGIKGFHEFCTNYFPKTKKILFLSVLFIILVSNFNQSNQVLAIYGQEARKGTKERELKALGDWVSSQTKDSDLIAATDFILSNVDLNRPMVNIPTFLLLKKSNLENFITIYKPKVFVFENTLPIQDILVTFGYSLARNDDPKGQILIYRRSF